MAATRGGGDKGLAMNRIAARAIDRRTSVSEIFDHLYDEIVSLRLRPGDKISEADIAASFGVSRQPARDAFSRLANLDLVLIRPQRATEVKRFSLREIEKSRFTRMAVEVEIIRRAAERCDKVGRAKLDMSLDAQAAAAAAGDHESFSRLDYEFHRTLCEIGEAGFAAELIAFEKAKVDRICMLSLSKEDRMPVLLEDHRAIAGGVVEGDGRRAADAGRVHLSRLDETIATIRETNADYFEPDHD